MVMASIDQVRASDGSGNAIVATVESSRAALASTINVDTVAGIPDSFMGSMGTAHTFTDPVTSEDITVISEATAVDFSGHVDGSNLEIDDIAPGYVDGGSEIGDIVIIRPTTQWADNVADVLDVAHDNDGSLKDDSVDTDQIANGAVEPDQLASNAVETTKIAAGAVTPAKRAGGYKIGTWTASATGDEAITGLGFQPKMVEFRFLHADGTTLSRSGWGVADGSSQFAVAMAVSDNPTAAVDSNVTVCILGITGSGSILVRGTLVSFDADGFTVNMNVVNSGPHTIGYIAYG